MLTLIQKTEVAIFISHRADIRAQKVTIDKEGHYMMIKGSILQECIKIFNVYAPKNRV